MWPVGISYKCAYSDCVIFGQDSTLVIIPSVTSKHHPDMTWNVLKGMLNQIQKIFLLYYRFFVVEDHILSTTLGLVNRAYMDELWDMSVAKLKSSLRTSCVSIRSSLWIHVHGINMCVILLWILFWEFEPWGVIFGSPNVHVYAITHAIN